MLLHVTGKGKERGVGAWKGRNKILGKHSPCRLQLSSLLHHVALHAACLLHVKHETGKGRGVGAWKGGRKKIFGKREAGLPCTLLLK